MFLDQFRYDNQNLVTAEKNFLLQASITNDSSVSYRRIELSLTVASMYCLRFQVNYRLCTVIIMGLPCFLEAW